MKKLILSTLTAFLAIGCINSTLEKKVTIAEQTFTCEIAKTEKQRQQGLMNREQLDQNHGILFIFEKPDYHTFWMKDTPLPLDIIWIDEKNQVSQFTTAQPCTMSVCPVYRPDKIAAYVLEVPAGNFTGQVGDKFRVK